MCMDTILMVKWIQGKKSSLVWKWTLYITLGFFGAEAEKEPQGFLCRNVFGDINESKSIRVMVDFQEKRCDIEENSQKNKIIPLFIKYRKGGMF